MKERRKTEVKHRLNIDIIEKNKKKFSKENHHNFRNLLGLFITTEASLNNANQQMLI